MNVGSIAESIKDYLGAYTASSGDLSALLSSVVSKYTSGVYFDETKLRSAMQEFGATNNQVLKICIMTNVNGFRELLEKDARVQQVDLDRYVQNAIKETGFNHAMTLELISAIAVSAGIAFDYMADICQRAVTAEKRAYVVPAGVYEGELKRFEIAFSKGDYENIPPQELTRLETLAAVGIPKAKYYLGYCLLKNEQYEKNSPFGLQILEEAAAEGDSSAAGALGDYHYEQGSANSWSRAYEYYTGYGAVALNKSRRDALASIVNEKIYNRKMIIASVFLAIIMLATLVIAPGINIYAAHRIAGTICFLGSVVLVVASALHYKVRPYDSIYWVPCLMFVVWFLYIAIRLIF